MKLNKVMQHIQRTLYEKFDIEVSCPRCGSQTTLDALREDRGGYMTCEECKDSILLDRHRIRRATSEAQMEATQHNSEYSAGMHLAVSIVESELIEEVEAEEECERKF